MKLPIHNPEVAALLECSARLGRNPLMVQGSTGNTSIKLGDTLWVKASGRWLARAEVEPIFVPVGLSAARYSMGRNTDPCLSCASALRASVETAMHCVIPWRVVIHVHSVNSIAWAVRRDAPSRLAAALDGIPWRWIPYAPSGLPLAREIEKALRGSPAAQAFILGNHGIVTAGEDCASAYRMLRSVDDRLALPSRFRAEPESCSGTTSPAGSKTHAAGAWLAGDPGSRRILSGGYLYPCHALFLAARQGIETHPDEFAAGELSAEASEILTGLAEVVSRIPAAAPIRYLTSTEVAELLAANVYQAPALDTGSAMNLA